MDLQPLLWSRVFLLSETSHVRFSKKNSFQNSAHVPFDCLEVDGEVVQHDDNDSIPFEGKGGKGGT